MAVEDCKIAGIVIMARIRKLLVNIVPGAAIYTTAEGTALIGAPKNTSSLIHGQIAGKVN